MRLSSRVLPFATAAIVLPLLSHAQEYRGTLSGTVTDPTGARIPGASITAKSPEQTYEATSDNSGRFVIPYAQPNTYAITVKANGFATAEFPNVVLQVSATVDIPATLKIGTAGSEVTVDADPFLLATTDASGGTVLDPEKIQNLPLNGRHNLSADAAHAGRNLYPDAVWRRWFFR